MDLITLRRGLAIISRCKCRTGDIWEAHFGAAAIASYFFVQENAISMKTAAIIKTQSEAMLEQYEYKQIDQAIAATMDWQEAESLILESLDSSIQGLHWVGHNVIYAALSLLALRELKGWGTKEDVKGISTLILSFDKAIPGRSWIGYSVADVKKMTIDEKDAFPAIEDADQLSQLIMSELSSFRTIFLAEAHHDLIGHMLTYSHALNILYDLGHEAYFKHGLRPLLLLIKVLRASREIDLNLPIPLKSPVDRLPLVKAERSVWLPTQHEYWLNDYSQQDWDYGHVFKFPFSYYHHARRLRTYRPDAEENFRYIISRS